MKSDFAPWWRRGWQGWWAHQRTVLRLEDPAGQYHHDEHRHEVRWQGCLTARDRRRWSMEILWGPGTPFLAPRVYLDGVFSCRHQLRDRSLCLAPPGLGEIFEIDQWLEQTRTWLELYLRERWGTDESVWRGQRHVLPDPEYRPHERPRSYILVPSAWSPDGEYGELFARVPSEGGGLGTLMGWRNATDQVWHDWDGGTVFTSLGNPVLPGFWLREWDGTLPYPLVTWIDHRLRDSGAWLLGLQVQFQDGTSGWQFSHCDPRREKSFWKRLLPMRANPADLVTIQEMIHSHFSQKILPGLPLASDPIAVRAKVSRSEQMDTQIRGACVVIVGIGALGSEVAHLLAKEQVGHFILIDGDLMLPGNVARHRLDIGAVGGTKAEKMREDILRHHPGASVKVLSDMLDEVLPELKLPEQALMIGCTGDLPSERVLASLAAERRMPCVHAWTECDGRLLRLIRTLPGQDVGLHELGEIPEIPWPKRSEAAEECVQLVLPGSSINLHAAANRTARLVLELLSKPFQASQLQENHTFFTAEGLENMQQDIPTELLVPYGQLRARIEPTGKR